MPDTSGAFADRVMQCLFKLQKEQIEILKSIALNMATLQKADDRLTVLETAIEQEKLKRDTEITALHAEIANYSRDATVSDPCEIKIHAILQANLLDTHTFANKTPEALGFADLGALVIDTGAWTGPVRTSGIIQPPTCSHQ